MDYVARRAVDDAIGALQYARGAHSVSPRDYAKLVVRAARSNRSVVGETRDAVGALIADDVRPDPGAAYAGLHGALKSVSPFDQWQEVMQKVPMRRSVGVVSLADAGIIAEGRHVPVLGVTATGAALNPIKAGGIVAFSSESGEEPSVIRFVERELVRVVNRATNGVFLPGLLDSSSTVIPSTATDLAGMKGELEELLSAIAATGAEELRFAVHPTVATFLSTQDDRAFSMTPRGGTICGVPAMASDRVPIDSTGSSILLVDVSQIAFADEGVELSRANQASLRMHTNPDSNPDLVSLFQTDTHATKVIRTFAFARLGDGAVGALSGVTWTGVAS
jgi:hypothetical protein